MNRNDDLDSAKGIILGIVLGAIIIIFLVCSVCTALCADYTQYRKAYCEVKGCTNLNIEAHHIYAQSQRPDLADGDGGKNIISLCRPHHVSWGHGGNCSKWYNTNIVQMVQAYNTGLTEMKKHED